MKKKIIFLVAAALMLNSCDDLFEPAIENFKDVEQMYDDAQYAQGFLVNVYRCVPGYYDNSEYATDDAVINQKNNAFLTMATGGWTSRLWTPINQWTNSFSSIQYINLFLENVDKVRWSDDAEKAQLFARRTKGEAYGLRGMFLYYLLRAHAGFGENGELLGVPRLTEYLTINSDLNLPRASFADCVQQIYSDLEKAEELLPWEYNDVNEVPADFQSITQDKGKYNTVMGEKSRQLFNGLIARAYRVRTALLAASPAFQDASNPASWADAANAAAAVLNYNGGLGGLDDKGVEYYSKEVVENLQKGINPKEIIWRENVSNSEAANSQEANNFPPSLNGSGNMNPSQNLVDAFPMANGYPISDIVNSNYDKNNPYKNREKRFYQSILYDGSMWQGEEIITRVGVGSPNEIDTSSDSDVTNTGYYTRKTIDESVNGADNLQMSNGMANYIFFRYADVLLMYAEASLEAGDKPTAVEYLDMVRTRGGNMPSIDDTYPLGITENQLREIIRRDRRIELAFEDKRWWDILRWKICDGENGVMNKPIGGMKIEDTNGDGVWEYNYHEVGKRTFLPRMYYQPIPQYVIDKNPVIREQNGGEDGWVNGQNPGY